VNNAEPGFLNQQTMRVSFSRFTRAHSVYIVHRKRGLPATYSIADMAADYARVLRAITPSAEAAHVIGLSTGGLIAQHLAAHSPVLIERLVLVVSGRACRWKGADWSSSGGHSPACISGPG
jgi:pimeloyl-ACP methyl ester carboxylesterase